MLKVLVLMSALLFSSSAWAVFDIQAYMGKRYVEYDTVVGNEFEGLNYGAAFHFSPIPFVPVALGMAAEYVVYDEFASLGDATGYLVMPQIYAWLPIDLISVNPFVKLGYAFGALTAEGKVNNDDTKLAFKVTGSHMTAGVKWEPPLVPFLALMVQYDIGFEESSKIDVEVNGVKSVLNSGDGEEFKSTAWHIGVEFKI